MINCWVGVPPVAVDLKKAPGHAPGPRRSGRGAGDGILSQGFRCVAF